MFVNTTNNYIHHQMDAVNVTVNQEDYNRFIYHSRLNLSC